MTRFACLALLSLLILAPGCGQSDSAADASGVADNPGSSAPAGVPAEPSPEYKLAAIQKGYVTPDDPLVKDIAVQIDALQKKSDATREQITNLAVVSHDLMRKRGVDESYLSILQHVNRSIPVDSPQGKHLVDIFAAYVTLRTPH